MKFNNIDVENVTFNGHDVSKVIFNGVTVFEKSESGGEIDILESSFCHIVPDSGDGDIWITKNGNVTQSDFLINDGTKPVSESTPWDGSRIEISAEKGIWIKSLQNGSEQKYSDYISFGTSTSFKIIGGNISNLKNYDGMYTYRGMFKSSGVSYVADSCMPIEDIKYGGCYEMFRGNPLTSSPEINVTSVEGEGLAYMFSGCPLTTAGDLNLGVTGSFSMRYMFWGCTSLTQTPSINITRLGSYCCAQMFTGCTSLTTAHALPATQLSSYCYQGMFDGCTSLTTAPELPATQLATGCYSQMFTSCTSLTTAPELPATTLEENCYYYMFGSCTSLTTAPELPATQLARSCYSGMFSSCTSLTTAPELPATQLALYCYESMFWGCTNLNYLKANVEILAYNSTKDWLINVSRTGTFVQSPTCTLTRDQLKIPAAWELVTASE